MGSASSSVSQPASSPTVKRLPSGDDDETTAKALHPPTHCAEELRADGDGSNLDHSTHIFVAELVAAVASHGGDSSVTALADAAAKHFTTGSGGPMGTATEVQSFFRALLSPSLGSHKMILALSARPASAADVHGVDPAADGFSAEDIVIIRGAKGSGEAIFANPAHRGAAAAAVTFAFQNSAHAALWTPSVDAAFAAAFESVANACCASYDGLLKDETSCAHKKDRSPESMKRRVSINPPAPSQEKASE